jgi:hypothetical protein
METIHPQSDDTERESAWIREYRQELRRIFDAGAIRILAEKRARAQAAQPLPATLGQIS